MVLGGRVCVFSKRNFFLIINQGFGGRKEKICYFFYIFFQISLGWQKVAKTVCFLILTQVHSIDVNVGPNW